MRPLVGAAFATALAATGGCLAGTLPVPSPTDVNPAAPAASAAARETVIIHQLKLVKMAEIIHFSRHNRYGAFEDLVKDGGLNQAPTGLGYDIALTVTKEGNGYEIQAKPREYGPSGQRSFWLDETGVLRGANHFGGPASAEDPPVIDEANPVGNLPKVPTIQQKPPQE
jgi:hypothetical protein